MKRKILCLMLILAMFCLVFVGCGGDAKDDKIFLTLVGVEETNVKISIKQIKQLTPTVIEKAFATDKFEDGTDKPDYHKVKGVYLDDILANFTTAKAKVNDFGSIEVKSTDGYGTNLVYDNFKLPQSLLICYEYDGEILNQNSNSGSLRLIANEQAMSMWVKKVDTLIFGSDEKRLPEINSVFFLENMTALAKEVEGFSNKCIKIKDLEAFLKTKEQITDMSDSSLFLGLDYKNDTYVEYKSFKGYGEFSNGYIVLDAKDDNVDKAPQYNAPTLAPGMKVSNLLKFNISKSQILCLNKAELYFPKTEGFVSLETILNNCALVGNNFKIINASGNETTITSLINVGIKLDTNGEVTIKNGAVTINNVTQIKKI